MEECHSRPGSLIRVIPVNHPRLGTGQDPLAVATLPRHCKHEAYDSSPMIVESSRAAEGHHRTALISFRSPGIPYRVCLRLLSPSKSHADRLSRHPEGSGDQVDRELQPSHPLDLGGDPLVHWRGFLSQGEAKRELPEGTSSLLSGPPLSPRVADARRGGIP